MLKNDYMKEMENSLTIVKREVDKSIANNEIEKAFDLINRELKGLIGLDVNTVETLAFDSVKTMITRDNQYNAEKYIALAEILSLEGIISERIGDENNKIFYYNKALEAFIQAYEEDDNADRKYLDDAKMLVDDLKQYELKLEDEKKRVLIYELLGEFDNAEDILFHMLKTTSNKEEIKNFGLAFYNRLKEKSNEILEAGNLPLEEVEEGIIQIKSI